MTLHSSQQLIAENTPFTIVVSLVMVGLLAWRLGPSAFRSLRGGAVAAAPGLFWGTLAAVLITFAWDFYYGLFTSTWYRYAAPLGALSLYAALGWGMWWVAGHLPGHPVLTFCLLGGLESLPEHAIGIYRFRILELPILQGSTPASIFIFAFFEYMVYWAIALFLAVGIDGAMKSLAGGSGGQAG